MFFNDSIEDRRRREEEDRYYEDLEQERRNEEEARLRAQADRDYAAWLASRAPAEPEPDDDEVIYDIWDIPSYQYWQ